MALSLKMMIITIALFTVSITVNAATPICDPALKYLDTARCSKMTNNAPTWAEATVNAIKYELGVVKSGQSIAYSVGSNLSDDLEPSQKQEITDTCGKNYVTMIENLKKSLGYVKKDPYPGALDGAVSGSNFLLCTNTIGEVTDDNVPANVAKYGDEIEKNTQVLVFLAKSRPKA